MLMFSDERNIATTKIEWVSGTKQGHMFHTPSEGQEHPYTLIRQPSLQCPRADTDPDKIKRNTRTYIDRSLHVAPYSIRRCIACSDNGGIRKWVAITERIAADKLTHRARTSIGNNQAVRSVCHRITHEVSSVGAENIVPWSTTWPVYRTYTDRWHGNKTVDEKPT